MADYQWKIAAQQWRDDPYYVASSAPIQKVTVVAPTKQEAINEAARILGPAADHRHWRYWVGEATDIRLLTPTETP